MSAAITFGVPGVQSCPSLAVVATIHSLPPELLLNVLSFAAEADLCSAALVCRDWGTLTQKSLFRRVEINEDDQASLFVSGAERGDGRCGSWSLTTLAPPSMESLSQLSFEAAVE